MKAVGRPAKIQPADMAQLVAIVQSDRAAPLAWIRQELQRRTGIDVHEQTLAKTLRKHEIRRTVNAQAKLADPKPPRPSRAVVTLLGHASDSAAPGGTTDAEWALVHDLFENPGGRGVPPKVSRRVLVDACCYVVRTGCSWRMLPPHFPPWQNVYRTFRRWSEQGKFEQMHDRLRQQWRERLINSKEPEFNIDPL
jgi:transposase